MNIADEYKAERERLEMNRMLDWSSFCLEYRAAGEVLTAMTVQTWFDLLALNSPLLVGRIESIESLVDYIWRNSKRHTENKLLKEWRLFWLERRVYRELKKNYEAIIDVVTQHAKSQLDEFPNAMGKEQAGRSNKMSTISGEASMIDEIAHRYALHPDEVLRMPLRQAFALQRTIRVSTIPDYKLLEPDSLREIKSRYIENLNRQNNGGGKN